jgi:hypothetical protein
MRLIRDWSGIAFVPLLVVGLLQDDSEFSVLGVTLLALAVGAYSLCWYNFAVVADDFEALPIRQGLAISAIGVVSTALAIANFGVSGPVGWVFLGLAMVGVGYALSKAQLMPNGFALLSALAGVATIVVGVTGDTTDVGAGAMFIVLGWTISMSILFIVWGHLDEDEESVIGTGR